MLIICRCFFMSANSKLNVLHIRIFRYGEALPRQSDAFLQRCKNATLTGSASNQLTIRADQRIRSLQITPQKKSSRDISAFSPVKTPSAGFTRGCRALLLLFRFGAQ
jgi:hypothetical protein